METSWGMHVKVKGGQITDQVQYKEIIYTPVWMKMWSGDNQDAALKFSIKFIKPTLNSDAKMAYVTL